ncbi:MAG: glycosyltransferase [Methylomonas sp.]|nr:glycosyltransferase [Methylomonas sp.]
MNIALANNLPMTILSKPKSIAFELQTFILNIRPDLRKLGFDLADRRIHFLAWLVTSGTKEYRAVMEDPGFLQLLSPKQSNKQNQLTPLQTLIFLMRPDVQSAFPLPSQINGFLQWFYTYGVEECGYWPFLSDAEKRLVLEQSEPWGSRLKKVILDLVPPQAIKTPLAQRPFGVNLIGYAFGQLGIGEDARMAARSLLAVDVPMTMLNFPPGSDIPQNDRSMAAHVSEHGDFAFNLFCMTAEENGRFYAERGRSQFLDRYNIGYWPWELSQWPAEWEMLLDLVDEVWVSTKHTYDALAPICTKPLFIMPMAVALGSVTSYASRTKARMHFGLPTAAKLFCFAFDLKSSVERKNPQACVDAFLAAFPRVAFSADAIGLVIKVHKPTQRNRAWEKLKRLAAEDDRIHIIENTLSRPDLLALYKACDCFVSLHRAEGFGRGLAEALQLGLHVIATGYSGNVDFCKPSYADLVRHRLIKVRKNQYPHAAGQVWAEPDVEHAAELMRNFVLHPPRSKRKEGWQEFSTEVIGERYRYRLEQIHDQIMQSG